MDEPIDGPYSGLAVLDLSQGIAGPYCPALLRQHGAEVIKVEPPSGDWIRIMGGGEEGMTALAVANNLGKRSICIDVTRPAGRGVLETLAKRADVLVENFRPGVMERLGIGYEALSAVNPRLIYVSITGFGESGPLSHKPATDSVLQAMTGMATANRDESGRPRRIGLYVPDTITALYAVKCVGAALYARDARKQGDGRGRHVRISLAECCAAFQSGPILEDFLFAGQYKPPISVPSGVFATRDGHLVVATLRDSMWEGVCRALGREDWLSDPRFSTREQRGRHEKELTTAVAEILRERATADWAALLERHDVLCAPVQNYQALRDDPQMKHMRYFGAAQQHPYGEVPVPHTPGTPRDGVLPAAPLAGQHTREILVEAGYDAERIAELERDGLVVQAS
ncbi:MAG: CoA transferase [Burkholderiaceae bacterium]|nr:CoA transferase [Burkholderiaceae bacterium]